MENQDHSQNPDNQSEPIQQGYTQITLKDLINLIPKINSKGKIPFIIDRDFSSPVCTFLSYNFTELICYVDKFVVENALGGSLDIGDEMRKKYISACKTGRNLVMYFGEAVPKKWLSYVTSEKTAKHKFNQNVIFDLKKNRKRAYFQHIVKPDEDFD